MLWSRSRSGGERENKRATDLGGREIAAPLFKYQCPYERVPLRSFRKMLRAPAPPYERWRRDPAARWRVLNAGETFLHKDTLGAGDLVSAGPLDSFPDGESEGLERGLRAEEGERESRWTLRTSARASSKARMRETHMWWLFTPRIESTCSVTPAAMAKDSKTCEIISVDTGGTYMASATQVTARLAG